MTNTFVNALRKVTRSGPREEVPNRPVRSVMYEMNGVQYYYTSNSWVVLQDKDYLEFASKEFAEEYLGSLPEDRKFVAKLPDGAAPKETYYTVKWNDGTAYGLTEPQHVSPTIDYAAYSAANRAHFVPSERPEIMCHGHTFVHYNTALKEFVAMTSTAQTMCGITGEAVTKSRSAKVDSLYGSESFFTDKDNVTKMRLQYVDDLNTHVSMLDPEVDVVHVQGGRTFTRAYIDSEANKDQFAVSALSGRTFYKADSVILHDGRVVSSEDFKNHGFKCTVSGENHLNTDNPVGHKRKIADAHYVPSFEEIRKQRTDDPQTFFGHVTKKVGRVDGKIPSKNKKMFMSCEIEVYSGTDMEGAKAMVSIEKNKLGISCYDGSLPARGFEVKTTPEEGRLSSASISKLASIFKENKIKANNTCGVHIHVSRAALTELQIDRIESFIYKFSNKAFVEAIAGRPSNTEYARYDKPKHKNSMISGKKKKSSERRVAVNVTPEHTMEFRLFAGTVNEDTLHTYVEFAAALIEFTAPGVSEVPYTEAASYRDFIKFLLDPKTNRRKEYRHLVAFLVEKNIMNQVSKKKSA